MYFLHQKKKNKMYFNIYTQKKTFTTFSFFLTTDNALIKRSLIQRQGETRAFLPKHQLTTSATLHIYLHL